MAERTGEALDLLRGQGPGADRTAYDRAVQNANVVWWQRHTGTKVLLSAHDEHVGYVAVDPASNPKTQGAFLRETLGAGYVSVGVTFDRVRHRDYVVDLRSVGSPAREWLAKARPTRTIGTAYPDGPNDIVLRRSHDVLIHLHEVETSTLRDV
ncbi:erythromycin esterase family protein [Streptomyces sp. GESEQ-4]|uniref:erythromycin esterase family protein n=1 Tax=Streptomyces sp. GESEQ-4 TaxID=2812655 RepID=UPI0027DCD6AC|nr:erythromycin esterase family protein [Streptomyces sp. GESEQ-4]